MSITIHTTDSTTHRNTLIIAQVPTSTSTSSVSRVKNEKDKVILFVNRNRIETSISPINSIPVTIKPIQHRYIHTSTLRNENTKIPSYDPLRSLLFPYHFVLTGLPSNRLATEAFFGTLRIFFVPNDPDFVAAAVHSYVVLPAPFHV